MEFLYFLALKRAVQEKYLESHSPFDDDISGWKGTDILYFQEELRQKTKGNISERSFYTYFKNNSEKKIPRIDMLNILSLYTGHKSWSDFKKNNPIDDEKNDISETSKSEKPQETISENIEQGNNVEQEMMLEKNIEQKIKQNLEQKLPFPSDNQIFNEIAYNVNSKSKKAVFIRKYLWLGMSIFLFILVLFLIFNDRFSYKKYNYTFIDADRNSSIKGELDVKIIRKNESPILFKVKPNSPFVYNTKSKSLKMIISSPFYKTDTIVRDLTNAPDTENIELKPDDYAIQLYYYSKSINDFKKKTIELNRLISDNALIYQVFDNDIYGIETMDKQKYISLVTLPTTSLENLEVIDSQMKNGKIVMIKFKITGNEKTE